MRINFDKNFIFKLNDVFLDNYFFTRFFLFLLAFLFINDCNAQNVFLSKQIFNYTGTDQVLTIPACVYQIKLKTWGAGGGGSSYQSQNGGGGGGGYTEGFLVVNPGDVFSVMVGEGGACDGTVDNFSYGFGGAFSSQNYGGFGGGLSGIFTGSAAITQADQIRALLISGGGGGAERDAPSTYCTSGGQGGDINFGGGMPSLQGEGGGPNIGGGGGGGYNGGIKTLRLSGNGIYYAGEGGTNFIHSSVTAGVSLASTDFGNWNTFPATYKDPPNIADIDYTPWVNSSNPGIGTGSMYTYFRAGNGRVVVEFYGLALVPLVNITAIPTSICSGEDVVFSATPTNNGANPAYQWQLNGVNILGATGTAYSANTLNNGDIIGVVLVSDCAVSAVATDTLVVHPNPISNFNTIPVCNGVATVFSDGSNTASGSLSSWEWDFGDISPFSNSPGPSHLYSNGGNYNATLIVKNNFGCADTITKPVQVFYKPTAAFAFNDACLNQIVNFTDSSIVASGTISDWLWNYADGSLFGTSQNSSHTYTNAGSYLVSLIATSNNGCKDTIVKTTVVHPLPFAQFLVTNVCEGSSSVFIDESTISTPDALQFWTWNFGDGSPAGATQNPSHVYQTPGNHVVQLITISDFGCLDSISKTLIVNPSPIVKFSASDTTGCSPLCITFSDLSASSIITIDQWVWNVGDGSSSGNSQNFDHCYINTSVDSIARFTISLTVTTDSGCIATGSKNNYINVYPNPIAEFSVNPSATSITDPIISVSNISSGASFWDWNFGGGVISSMQNPVSQIYQDTGTYRIALIVSTQYSCRDTAYKTITIEPDFIFYIPNAFTPDGDGTNDTFIGKGIFIKEFEMMIFDRWGNLIYFTDTIDLPWDGKANHGSEIAQEDVYVYSIKVFDFKNLKHKYIGTVTLVR